MSGAWKPFATRREKRGGNLFDAVVEIVDVLAEADLGMFGLTRSW